MEPSLQTAWNDLVRRVAVLTGAGAGLISLLVSSPVHIAAMRGACALIGCHVIGRIGALAIASTTERANEASAQEANVE